VCVAGAWKMQKADPGKLGGMPVAPVTADRHIVAAMSQKPRLR
jgi:hypothetical protein